MGDASFRRDSSALSSNLGNGRFRCGEPDHPGRRNSWHSDDLRRGLMGGAEDPLIELDVLGRHGRLGEPFGDPLAPRLAHRGPPATVPA
jgi:hypothetical protein